MLALRYGATMTTCDPPRKAPAADYQPPQAELDEAVTIDATPDELAAAVMSYRATTPSEAIRRLAPRGHHPM